MRKNCIWNSIWSLWLKFLKTIYKGVQVLLKLQTLSPWSLKLYKEMNPFIDIIKSIDHKYQYCFF